MTTLTWTFDQEFCPIESHPYAPAKLASPTVAPCPLSWRRFGRLMAGALWLEVAVGISIAHGRVVWP